MPTYRPRKLRLAAPPDAMGWCRTADADRFFSVETDRDYPAYAGAITRLPAIKSWWNPLTCIWLWHTKGVPLPAPAPGDVDALTFVLKLHDEFLRRKGATTPRAQSISFRYTSGVWI